MAKRKNKKPTNRFRLRFPFWLNLNKPDEADLADKIELLKNERSFTKTIRDGIRLICDLRAGQVDVLFELFPWVRDKMVSHTTLAPTTAIEAQLRRLEAALAAQPAPVVDAAPAGPKPLAFAKISKPIFDEDDAGDVVIKKTDKPGQDPSTKLFNQLFGSIRPAAAE